jgi:hypothetical protein
VRLGIAELPSLIALPPASFSPIEKLPGLANETGTSIELEFL